MHALLCVLLYRDVGVDYQCVFFSGHWWLIAGQVKVVRDQVTGELLRQSIVPYHMDSLVKGSQRRHKAAMQRLEYVYFYFFSLKGLKIKSLAWQSPSYVTDLNSPMIIGYVISLNMEFANCIKIDPAQSPAHFQMPVYPCPSKFLTHNNMILPLKRNFIDFTL